MKLREQILSLISQEDIFEFYLGVSKYDINYCLQKRSNKVNNPDRIDLHPSLGFIEYVNKDGDRVLYCRDFAEDVYRGDCFTIAALKLGRVITKPNDFIFVCEHIIKHLILKQNIKFSGDKMLPKRAFIKSYEPRTKFTIDYTYEYSIEFVKYWSRILFTDTEPTLREKNIYQAQRVFIDDILDYIYSSKNFAIVYHFGTFKNNDLVKVYTPNDKVRFKTNNKIELEAILELTGNDILIICKSRKDAVVLYSIAKHLGIDNIHFTSITSESTYLTDENLVKYIQNKYKKIYTWLDWDNVGILFSYYLDNKYGFKPLFIANNKEVELSSELKKGIFSRLKKEEIVCEVSIDEYIELFEVCDINSKDVSDMICEIGKKRSLHIIENIFINIIKSLYEN
jgi:hypothetical protein